MEAGLPEEDSEQSREGQLLHDYSAHPEYERKMLKTAQQDLLKIADDLTRDVCDLVEKDTGLTFAKSQDFVERTFTAQVSGTPDLLRYYLKDHSSVALVIDRKFGYNVVDRAEVNLQLRVYAILTWLQTVEKSYVAIVQPRAPFDERITLASYTREDIEAARKQILEILKATKDTNAPLVAGEAQCRYCKAKLMCPAFGQAMTLPTDVHYHPEKAMSVAARTYWLEERLRGLTNEQLEKTIEAVKLAGLIKEPANDEMRKRISAGTMPGYSLGKESEVRDIVDVKRAVGLLSIAGFSTDEIYGFITGMAIGRIEEKLRETNPKTTAKDAKEWVNTKLSKVIETENRKPKIIKDKAP